MPDSSIENHLHVARGPAPHGDDVARAAIDPVPPGRDGVDVEVSAGALHTGETSPVEQALAAGVPGAGAQRASGTDAAPTIDLAFTNPSELPGR